MNSLIKLESTFQDYLLHANEDIFHHVVGTSKVPIEVRLEIYSYAYRSRLHEAMTMTYSVLERYLGYEQFETLCYAYIDAHPSAFRSIRWFGDQLPRFLLHHSPYNEFPYLAELAQFEWTMDLVFDAADSEVVQLDDMQNIPPESWIDMRLQIHPSAHRLNLSWNVVPIWQAITDDQTPDEPQQQASAERWILWRKELTSQFSPLSEDESWAIDAIINNATFGEICEGLCQWIDEHHVGMHAASLLKGWITAGLISGIILDS